MLIKLKTYPKILAETNNSISLNLNEKNSFHSSGNKILYPKHYLINYFSLKTMLAKKNTGKLFELVLFGLNYNAKRVKHFRKPWVLDLQKSHKIRIAETRTSEIKTKIYKRRILFFSYNRLKLTVLVNLLKRNRKQNSYSGHGLITRNDKYSIKPGKIRQK